MRRYGYLCAARSRLAPNDSGEKWTPRQSLIRVGVLYRLFADRLVNLATQIRSKR